MDLKRCACGCGDAVKPGNRYASRGCVGRVVFRAQPRAFFLAAVQRREARMTPAQKRARIEKLVGRQRAEERERMLAIWLQAWEGGDPRAALQDAYRHGYKAGYSLRTRRERAA